MTEGHAARGRQLGLEHLRRLYKAAVTVSKALRMTTMAGQGTSPSPPTAKSSQL